MTDGFTSADIPADFATTVSQHVPDTGMATGADWLLTLPRLVHELLEQWALSVSGPPRHGYAAVVLPVRREDGTAAALRVVWPHPEAADEHLALRAWGGRGAVRMLATDRTRWATLLEWLEPRDLSSLPVLDACAEIGGLLRALDRPALPWARPLTAHLDRLVDDIDRLSADQARAFPRRMLDQGRSLARDLASEPGVDARLLHTDLHQHNVLWRPDPGQWVAIDPQTMAAEPAFGVAPALWNQWDQALAASDLRTHIGLRCEVICDAGGLDPDRTRALSIIRMVRNAVWTLQAPTARAADDLTQIVALVKALNP